MPDNMSPLQVLAAKLVHYGLYMLLLVQISIGLFLADAAHRVQRAQADKKSGNTARITLTPLDAADAESIEHAVRKSLDAYTFFYDIAPRRRLRRVNDGTTHVAFDPVNFMARLAALA